MARATRPIRSVKPEEDAYFKGIINRPTRPLPEHDEPELENEFDYERDLEINPHYIDAEFLNHPIIHMKYGKEAARAKKVAAEADEVVKTLRSQLVKEANEYPDKVLGKNVKATNPNVEAYYRDHEDYKEAKQKWIDAVYYADLMANVMIVMQARKSTLENLVRLNGQQYNSAPREPMELPEAAERLREYKQQLVDNRIQASTNRTRRNRNADEDGE